MGTACSKMANHHATQYGAGLLSAADLGQTMSNQQPESDFAVEQFELVEAKMHAEDDRVELTRMPDPTAIPADKMADYLHSLFEVGDTNEDGVLSPVQFAKLLSQSAFNFSKDVIDELVRAADVNGDGVIEYDEFVPAMLRVLNWTEEPAAAVTTAAAEIKMSEHTDHMCNIMSGAVPGYTPLDEPHTPEVVLHKQRPRVTVGTRMAFDCGSPSPRGVLSTRIEQLESVLGKFDQDPMEAAGRLTHRQMRSMGLILVQIGGSGVHPWKNGSAPSSPAASPDRWCSTPQGMANGVESCPSPGGQLVDSHTMRPCEDFIDYYRPVIRNMTDEQFFQCTVQFRRYLAEEVAQQDHGDVLGKAMEEQAWILRNVDNSRKAKLNPHVHVNENRIVSAAASVEAHEQRASISPVRSPSPTPDFTELDDQDWALRKLNKAKSNQPNTAPYDQWRLHKSPNISEREMKQENNFGNLDDQEYYLRKLR